LLRAITSRVIAITFAACLMLVLAAMQRLPEAAI
jgi:hypothetical protein